MRKKIIYTLTGIIVGMLLMSMIRIEFNPLSNQLVNAVLWYQHSDEMKAIYLQNFNLAKTIVLTETGKKHASSNPAIVVDIDETMLDNSPFEGKLVHKGKSYNSQLWTEWVRRKQAKALPGAVEFTQFAKRNSVEVFYISNRRVQDLDATIANLRKQGFAFADSAHVLLRDRTGDKTERRQQVSANHHVILYIGDNMGDFDEVYNKASAKYDSTAIWRDSRLWGSRYIVMPNPMYGTWEYTLFPQGKKLTALDKAMIKIKNIVGF